MNWVGRHIPRRRIVFRRNHEYKWHRLKGGNMVNISKLVTIALLVLVVQISCTKLPQAPSKEGALATIDVADATTIPREWGNLVSVVISPDFPRRVQLWFQNEKGDIHLAFYEMQQRKLAPKGVVFPRS
jgi:hypothetical protein